MSNDKHLQLYVQIDFDRCQSIKASFQLNKFLDHK